MVNMTVLLCVHGKSCTWYEDSVRGSNIGGKSLKMRSSVWLLEVCNDNVIVGEH